MAASASSWNIMPFRGVVPLPYNATFTADQLTRIKLGYIPREMEEHWFIYYEDPNLSFHRSWTGAPFYRVTFAPDERGVRVVEAVIAKWVGGQTVDGLRYHAALLDALISNVLLGEAKPYPMPPDVPRRAPVVSPARATAETPPPFAGFTAVKQRDFKAFFARVSGFGIAAVFFLIMLLMVEYSCTSRFDPHKKFPWAVY